MFNLAKSGAATFEAVSVPELKAHCRVSHTADDTYLGTLCIAAREQVEKDLNLAVAGQSYNLYTEEGFMTTVTLPIQPVLSITSVTYTDANGDTQTLPSGSYTLKSYRDPVQIEFGSGLPSATDVTITFVAGYVNAAAVPALIKSAIQFLAANWYENRESIVVGSTANPIPLGYERIIDRLRLSRFR